MVDDVAYSTKAPQASLLPAREMIVAPNCRSMAGEGVCRTQVVPEPVYCAMLLVATDAVSVIQMEFGEDHTNPYGLYAYASEAETSGEELLYCDVGGLTPVIKERRPPPLVIWGDIESVYIRAVLEYPQPRV